MPGWQERDISAQLTVRILLFYLHLLWDIFILPTFSTDFCFASLLFPALGFPKSEQEPHSVEPLNSTVIRDQWNKLAWPVQVLAQCVYIYAVPKWLISTFSHFTFFEMKAIIHCSFFLVEWVLLSPRRVSRDILIVRVGILCHSLYTNNELKQLQTLHVHVIVQFGELAILYIYVLATLHNNTYGTNLWVMQCSNEDPSSCLSVNY